jgi:hypothetical protein
MSAFFKTKTTIQLLEKRTKALVEQRRLERACLEQECVKMERQKKYLEAMLRYQPGNSFVHKCSCFGSSQNLII